MGARFRQLNGEFGTNAAGGPGEQHNRAVQIKGHFLPLPFFEGRSPTFTPAASHVFH
jgi:hypothetical protein